MTIRDVNLTNNGVGLYFRNTSSSNIENIVATGNWRGVFLENSDGNSLTNSSTGLNDWGNGIVLYNSDNNVISGNNSGSNGYAVGIFAIYSSGNTISDNNFSSNIQAGIVLSSGCAQNTVTGNTINHNLEGMVLYLAPNNTVYNNNFSGNGDQIRVFRDYTTVTTTYNGQTETHIEYVELNNIFNLPAPVGGNYWSNFSTSAQGCNDINADGFCDATYTFAGGRDEMALVLER